MRVDSFFYFLVETKTFTTVSRADYAIREGIKEVPAAAVKRVKGIANYSLRMIRMVCYHLVILCKCR